MKKLSIILLLVVTMAVVFPISNNNAQAAPKAPITTLDLPHIF